MELSYGGAPRRMRGQSAALVVPFLWNTDLADVTDLHRYSEK